MSTFTTNFGFEEIATGDQSGSWGDTTNFNYDILDRITSYKAVALSDASTATLTVREASPGTGTENLQDGMYRVIKFTGTLSQNCTITIAPNSTAAYFIFINGTTGGFSLLFSQGSGANYTLPADASATVYCDGAGAGAVVASANSDPLTTRGDLLYRDATNLSARLAVGSANYVLKTDGTDVSWGQASLTAGVTGTLPIANGGTNSTSTTYCSLTSNVTGTLPIANGGTNSTSTTYCDLTSNVTGTLPVNKGGTGAATHTANGVLIGEGTSAMTTVAPSTSGNVLTSDGTDWTSAAASGGGWEFVSSTTASSSSDVAFTGFSANYDYLIVHYAVKPATDSVYPQYQYGTGSTSYETSGYIYGMSGNYGSNSRSGYANTTTYIRMADTYNDSGSDGFQGGYVLIINPGDSGNITQSIWSIITMQSTPLPSSYHGGGWRTTAEATTAWKFYYSSGNIASGVFKLFKRANS